MAKPADWFIGILVLIVIFSFVFIGIAVLFDEPGDESAGFFSSGDAIAVVEITGPIFDSFRINSELKKWWKRSDIKAIVLRLDSPGGGVAASHEVYDMVRKITADGIPVISSMGTVAASGAYYIACATDEVFANPGTVTGSIGVIVEFPVTKGLLDKLGLQFETITSGTYKDTGNPAREMRTDEREYFQELVNDMYSLFVDIVAEGRGLSEEAVQQVADGRVFTGSQALGLGLIDSLGTFDDAVLFAKETAGLDEDAPVYRTPPKQWTILDLFTSDLKDFLLHLDYIPAAQYIMR